MQLKKYFLFVVLLGLCLFQYSVVQAATTTKTNTNTTNLITNVQNFFVTYTPGFLQSGVSSLYSSIDGWRTQESVNIQAKINAEKTLFTAQASQTAASAVQSILGSQQGTPSAAQKQSALDWVLETLIILGYTVLFFLFDYSLIFWIIFVLFAIYILKIVWRIIF